jgi:nucleoside-triphosphatase THEP1
MPKPKNPNNQYFHSGVEDAIHQYNLSTDDVEKNKLFRIIYPALAKVAEVWYNKIKPTYVELPMEDLQADCLCFLVQKMHMVKEGKGKAFSYLTVTARNYYIQQNMIAYRKKLKGYSLDSLPDTFDIEDVISDRVEKMEWNATLLNSFIEYIEENFHNIFITKLQKRFAEALFKKIKGYEFVDEINRRDILNELSTDLKIERGLITKHTNRIASLYTTFKIHFEATGQIPKFKEKLHLTKEDENYIKEHYSHYSQSNGINGLSRTLGIKYDIVRDWINEPSNLI